MSIHRKAYCDHPPCSSSTTLLRDEHVIAPKWIIANIADINGEWYDDSPVHALHFCSDPCYRAYLTTQPGRETEMDQAWKDMVIDFAIDESRGRAS